jgi:hypothetical protein
VSTQDGPVAAVPEDPPQAWTARRQLEHQKLVHERDALADEVARLRGRIAASAAPRHQLELTCDRCRYHITVVSSLAVDAAVFGSMLMAAAYAGRWRLGSETVASLGMAGSVPDSSIRDLCPACVALT